MIQEHRAPPQVLLPLRSILDPIDLVEAFARPQPLEIELGCGDGSFLARYAHTQPCHNFIGIERLAGRLRKLERKAGRLGLVNVRGIRIESSYFLEFLLPPHSVTAVHLYFPDPWPKRKHHRNRLVNERFPIVLSRALRPGGRVFFRTDHSEYYGQIKEVFAGARDFQEIEAPAELKAVTTDFEEDFQSKGIPTLYAAYELKT